MRRLWSWFRSVMLLCRAKKVYRLAMRVRADFDRCALRVRKLRGKHDSIERWQRANNESIAEELDRMDALVERHKEALEVLRQDNEIMRELTIPNMEASHRLLYERYSTMISIEVRRRVAVGLEDQR